LSVLPSPTAPNCVTGAPAGTEVASADRAGAHATIQKTHRVARTCPDTRFFNETRDEMAVSAKNPIIDLTWFLAANRTNEGLAEFAFSIASSPLLQSKPAPDRPIQPQSQRLNS
jgi:hypothetical protein